MEGRDAASGAREMVKIGPLRKCRACGKEKPLPKTAVVRMFCELHAATGPAEPMKSRVLEGDRRNELRPR